MSPENPDTSPKHEGHEKRNEQPEFASTLERLGLRANSPEVHDRWSEGLERYGNAFIAYLTFDDVHAEAADILQRFAVDYAATYANKSAAIEAFVHDMGWAAHRQEFGKRHPEAELYLRWDLPEIEMCMRDLYDLAELDGQTFLFLR